VCSAVILRAMPLPELFRVRRACNLAVLGLSLVFTHKISAQQSRLTMLDFSTGSEMEDYLRVMQIAGKVPLYPWSIRGFSRREITRLTAADSTGPWKLHDRLNKAPVTVGPLRLGATFNSAYPYGANDGPVWAGRGVTSVVSGGLASALGPISIAIDPLAFRANNTAFDLLPNGLSGPQAFNHGTYASMVDLPQRFGNAPYSRVDPGNSSIRFDSWLLTFGVSTANEWMGPATEYPYILGTNAPGFPHLFLGTGEPLNIWIGRLHARFMWGKLYQSDYSPVTGSTKFAFDTATGTVISGGTIRLATSGELVFLPRGIDGLEVGIARFFHVPNAAGEPNRAFWTKPLRLFFLKNEVASGDLGGFDNQEASAFFRWVFPHSGLEVFGERGFEDQLYDLRDLILNLDHEREYMLGFQKVLRQSSTQFDVLRGELVNYQEPGLARDRVEGGIYTHSTLRQGHTNRGQLLGASAGAGWAAASSIAWTRYSPDSRTTATLRRIVRDQRGDFQVTGVFDPRSSDVIVAAGLERMRFGRRADIGAKVEAMQDFNRNFSRDVPNLNLQITTQLHPW
jgi:hypothetical protein